MELIQWYPGHIAKAEKKLKEQLSYADAAIEVLDARLPLSSMYPESAKLLNNKPRIILLNKSDLADPETITEWIKIIKEKTQCPVISTCANDSRDTSKIINKIIQAAQPAIDAAVKKGMLPRAARAMVIGMPNTGKSSIINKLIKRAKARTGAKAGVTREHQLIRINPKAELLDTPGIIPLKLTNQVQAYKLAFTDSIGENAYEAEAVSRVFIQTAESIYPGLIKNHYKLSDDEEISIENIALKRNWLISGAKPDVKRCAQNILNDFRAGRLGRLTLDKYEQAV